MKTILILLSLFANYGLSQANDSVLISKKFELDSFVDSLVNNNIASIRTFKKTIDSDIPVEIFEPIRRGMNALEYYYIVSDSNKIPYYTFVSPVNKSADWKLVHSYYFNSIGNTIFYSFYLAYYDSLRNSIIRKHIDIYFSNNFEILNRSEWYDDDFNNMIEDISECQLLYNFDAEYLGLNEFKNVIKKYNIKL